MTQVTKLCNRVSCRHYMHKNRTHKTYQLTVFIRRVFWKEIEFMHFIPKTFFALYIWSLCGRRNHSSLGRICLGYCRELQNRFRREQLHSMQAQAPYEIACFMRVFGSAIQMPTTINIFKDIFPQTRQFFANFKNHLKS